MSNHQLFFVLLLLTGSVFACQSTTEPAADDATATDTLAPTTPAEADTPAADSTQLDGTYSVEVLNDQLASPRKEMTGDVRGIQVVINYGSPSVKGREIWGGLEPYDKVWRTGANEATSFTIEEDVLIEGEPLAAGSYGLFTIPGKESWTVIFNTVYDQWGDYEYDESKDVLRVTVSPNKLATLAETLEFKVQDDQVMMEWEFLQLPFTVTRP